LGGKGHEFIVELVGVFARQAAVTHYGVAMNALQSGGLADTATLGDVPKNGEDFFLRQFRFEQRSSLALGKSSVTGSAAEHPPLVVGPVVIAHVEVFPSAFSVIGTLGILATKFRQVLHDRFSVL
jgi:hypothetical protein